MAQAPRQRNHRHHRGPPTQRRLDSEDHSKRNSGLKHLKEPSPLPFTDSSQTKSSDATSLKEELAQVLRQAKDIGSDKAKGTEEEQCFSQNAHEKLLLACRVLSPQSPGDVDLMSKVVFALFNQDLIKDGSRSFESTETSGNGDTNNASMETGEHLNVDILRALSAVLFENGTLVKESLQDLFQIIVTVCGKAKRYDHSELRRMALNCLANLVHKSGSLFSTLHERMYDIVLTNLTATAQYEGTSAALSSNTVRRKDRGSERKVLSIHFTDENGKC
ncbi:hypothetical protein BGX34_010863 [Mortierella sp. NVP85]|nr:hypothetical protein BGX34_010863 [Mortierella sp. NVP85]